MLAVIKSVALNGMDAYPVAVEADVSSGLPSFDIVGLPDAAVRESRERVKAALKNAGFHFPNNRIIVNLAPADLKKDGTYFDLPIALALLCATDQVTCGALQRHNYFIGELSLDGGVAAVNGILPLVDDLGTAIPNAQVFLPAANIREAALSGRAQVYPVRHLRELTDHLEGVELIEPVESLLSDFEFGAASYEGCLDMKDIKGQSDVKRALEIAAAGGHNVLMIGPPGSGKTLLARSLLTILPPLTREEALRVTKLYSVASELHGEFIVKQRPFRSPHHTASAVSLTGGGRHIRPGEISLATCGILFLDEIVEFPKSVLQVLRQPLEDKNIMVTRAQGSVRYPADFQLVGACNPCPCGYLGDGDKLCTCTETQVKRYMGRLSGPLLDRIDLHVPVRRVPFADLHSEGQEETSADIRSRVLAARQRQLERYRSLGVQTNAQLARDHLDEICVLDEGGQATLARVFDRLKLTARAHDRILKVSRTIADLADSPTIRTEHILEAVQYRTLDRT